MRHQDPQRGAGGSPSMHTHTHAHTRGHDAPHREGAVVTGGCAGLEPQRHCVVHLLAALRLPGLRCHAGRASRGRGRPLSGPWLARQQPLQETSPTRRVAALLRSGGGRWRCAQGVGGTWRSRRGPPASAGRSCRAPACSWPTPQACRTSAPAPTPCARPVAVGQGRGPHARIDGRQASQKPARVMREQQQQQQQQGVTK